MSLPFIKSPASPTRYQKKKLSYIKDGINCNSKPGSISRPNPRYFVISPLIPKKLKYGKMQSRAVIKNPLKIVDAYNKEKMCQCCREDSVCSQYFKSLKPKLLNFLTPIARTPSRLKKTRGDDSSSRIVFFESKTYKVRRCFEIKKRLINITPDCTFQSSIELDNTSNELCLLNYVL